VKQIKSRCEAVEAGKVNLLDDDTALSTNSFEAAMHAAGGICHAIDKVMNKQNKNAFCAVRPPGHHAGYRGVVEGGEDKHGSAGFCLINNVAVGAAYARHVYRDKGVKKVAIIDFDVHHGMVYTHMYCCCCCFENLIPVKIIQHVVF
jgi:acetoin utilization deacetylase AcuC-like enzyme